ncbi:MAG: cytochrome c biogenesis protein ResB, partial [Gemmatimonadota bacterium]
CTIKRLQGNVRAAFGKSFKRTVSEIAGVQNARTGLSPASAEQTLRTVRELLARKFYAVHVKREDDGYVLFAARWGISRLGSFLTHSGLVIAVSGGLIASLLGYSVFRWGGSGDRIEAPDGGFHVRVEKFEIESNEAGQVKDYLSTLTVLEDGDSLFTKVIEVNHPLRYRGFSFYQSSYRPDDRDFEEAVIGVRDTSGNMITMVQARMGEMSAIPETPYTFEPVDFAGNFVMRGTEVFSDQRFNEFRNPAVKVSLFENDSLLRDGWIFKPQLAGFHPLLDDYGLELVDVAPTHETGLRITWNPGAPLIWVGLIVMTIGVCITFFLSHRRIWVVVQRRSDQESHVAMCGATNRDREMFEKQLGQIMEKIEKGGTS